MVASGKESDFQCRRCRWLRFDPGSGRFPGYANPFQYSCLGNPWAEEPGKLQSMGLQRVGYILVTKQAGKESLLNLVLETEILFSEEQYLTWILNQIEERVITSKQAEKLKRQTWSQTERGLGLSESQPRRDLQVKGSMSRASGSRWRSRRILLISCKTTKITTSCWTTTDRRTLESTKERYSTPKDKEEMAGDGRRGTITIKSNPIPTEWVTHNLENNNTKEDHPPLWRFGTARQASSLGAQQRNWESSGNLTGKASGIWLQDFHRTGGNRDSTLGGHKQNLACTKTQRKRAVTPQETEPKLPAMLEGILWRCGSAGAHHRDRGDWQQLSGNVSFGVNPLGEINLTTEPIDLRVGSPRPKNYQRGSATPSISR